MMVHVYSMTQLSAVNYHFLRTNLLLYGDVLSGQNIQNNYHSVSGVPVNDFSPRFLSQYNVFISLLSI